ncbi:hypothetical protein [Paenibacillus sp. 1P07SE]|uniref:hypothetical protein n=1 Tax=Paenibacillus sp. 1P07SE TaxID=3132209 RepID=UPI0039A4CE57
MSVPLQDVTVSYSFNNLASRQTEGEYTSFMYGIMHDDVIDKLKIQYKGKPFAAATIVDTPKGRIWYCLSDEPVNNKTGSDKVCYTVAMF